MFFDKTAWPYIQVLIDSLVYQNWFLGNNCWSYFQGYSQNQRTEGNFGQYAILEKPTNILLTRSHKERKDEDCTFNLQGAHLIPFVFFLFLIILISLTRSMDRTIVVTHICPPRTVYKVGVGIELETSSLRVRPSTTWATSQIS